MLRKERMTGDPFDRYILKDKEKVGKDKKLDDQSCVILVGKMTS